MSARLLLAVALVCIRAELVDRIAVSVGNSVITESEIRHQLKIRAFVEGSPLKLDEENKRAAADRLIEQSLIRREMSASRYAPAEPALAKSLLASFKQSRFQGDENAYQAELKRARLTEADVESSFLWQLTVLRFVEFRFRPGIQIPAEEVREYYDQKFVPGWKARTTDPIPTFEEAERNCEDTLIQERIDNQLDRWISLSRTQTTIQYRDEVFRDTRGRTP
jgi:peptidyl-prolyl cis-trans isomerase SurA